jgi:hypothetical protein
MYPERCTDLRIGIRQTVGLLTIDSGLAEETYHLGPIDKVGRWKLEACSHCPRPDKTTRMGKVEVGLRRRLRCTLAGTVVRYIDQPNSGFKALRVLVWGIGTAQELQRH